MKQTSILSIDRHFASDEAFHKLYPVSVNRMAMRHWTPLRIAKSAMEFLNTRENCSILDIGSGSGKFCLAAAHYAPHANLYGIEQRTYLVRHAKTVQQRIGLDNVAFIEGNFTALDFKKFDHFYFFNSFWENLDYTDKIDNTIDHSEALYDYYVTYLKNALVDMPSGTRIVTFHSLLDEVPKSYHLVKSLESGMLNFWIRK